MVAHATSPSRSAFRGARPFDFRTDLYAVARLLEEAFRPDHDFPFARIPLLREFGILLWTLDHLLMFEPFEGWVWIEEGRIVGNLTLTFDAGRSNCYYISNVAVAPAYRRQGIARALVQTALERLRAQRVERVLLNVRPGNLGAQKLYEQLGFQSLEMRGEWTLTRLSLAPRGVEEREEWTRWEEVNPRAVADLLRVTTPAKTLLYRRRRNAFELNWEDRIVEAFRDACTLQRTRRWAIYHAGRLAAMTMARGQRVFSPHRIAIETHPDFRGQIEDDCLATALRYLARFPSREIRVEASDSHPELIAALERRGFEFLKGLTLMVLEW